MQKILTIIMVCFFSVGMLIAQDLPLDGLVGYYKFDEEEPVVYDHSGNGLDGEVVGDGFYVEGVVGSGLYFNGTDSYVSFFEASEFDLTETVTLMAWVKPFDAGNGEHNPWISKGDHQYALKAHTGNKIEFFVYSNASWNSGRSSMTMDETWNDQWHHVAGVFDGNNLDVYVNGELDSTTEYVGGIDASTYTFCLGSNSEHLDRLFEGVLDEVAIYFLPLNADEIKAIYDSYSTDPQAVDNQNKNAIKDFSLGQNYPNPFNPETRITYSLSKAEHVTIAIYDMLGKEVSKLVDEEKTAGFYSAQFHANNLASGVYYYKMLVGNQFVDAKKMLLVR